MTARLMTLSGMLLACAACGSETPDAELAESTPAAAETPSPGFMSLHLYNPASDEVHEQLLTGLRQLNQAIADAGHPETQYQVWRVTGEQSGEHGYFFGSLWADRGTYDAVHAHDAYTSTAAALEDGGFGLPEDQIYNRYVELNPPTTDPAPMPEGATPLLALHRFNLPSADAEAALIAILEALSGAIADVGHPETRYSLWKVTGDQAGSQAYLFGSVWTDRATYDAVHAHPAFETVAEMHRPAYEELVRGDIYNRYEYVGPN